MSEKSQDIFCVIKYHIEMAFQIESSYGAGLHPREGLIAPEQFARERRFQLAIGEAGIMATRALRSLPPLDLAIKALPKKERKAAIKSHVEVSDNAANASIISRLAVMPEMINAEGEGGKDIKVNGYEIEEGTGIFGTAGGEEFDLEHDPVEGTELFVFGDPDSYSVLGLARKILRFDSDYAEKLAGPRRLDGKWSLDATVKENLSVLLAEMRRAKPNKNVDPVNIEAIVLDRPRNERIIREIQEFGSRVKKIQAGDCIPVMQIAGQNLWDNNIKVMMGIGGMPEAYISAMVAGLRQGFFQTRPAFDEDPSIRAVHNPILGIPELFPEGLEEAFVILAPLTQDYAFGQQGVRKYKDWRGSGDEIDILTIDRRGTVDKLPIPFRLSDVV